MDNNEVIAPMLSEIRGSAKRSINFLWNFVGEAAIDGTSIEHSFRVYGTAGATIDEAVNSPISYDWIKAESPNMFDEADEPDYRGAVEGVAQMYGLRVDRRSWTVARPGVERVAVLRP
jgi:hypothetical protein